MGAKLESWYKRKMVESIKDAGGYARRFEDQFAVGILDLVFKLPGMPVIFAEAKRFSYQQFSLSPRQWEEARQIIKAGGYAASIGIKIPEERAFITGLPRNKDGKVAASECLAQEPGESFPQLLKRWYGEEHVKRKLAQVQREPAAKSSGNGGGDGEGNPTRGSGSQFSHDWPSVDGVSEKRDGAPGSGQRYGDD